MRPEQPKSCRNCAASFTGDNGSQLFCRKNPPNAQVIPMPQPHPITREMTMGFQTVAAYPPVQPDQWCFQFTREPGQSGLLLS